MRAVPSRRRTARDRHDDSFEDPQPTDEGWAKYNVHYWRRDWPGFAEWFASRVHLHRAAFDQADRGRGRLDPRDRPGDDHRDGACARTCEPPPGWTPDDPSHGPGWAFAAARPLPGARRERHRRPTHVRSPRRAVLAHGASARRSSRSRAAATRRSVGTRSWPTCSSGRSSKDGRWAGERDRRRPPHPGRRRRAGAPARSDRHRDRRRRRPAGLRRVRHAATRRSCCCRRRRSSTPASGRPRSRT